MTNTKHISARLISLDAFRGLTIAAMILVNNPGSWDSVFPFLSHAEWNGCTLADLIFPFFILIVGLSISFSMNRYKLQPELHRKVIITVLKRSAILFSIGLFLNALPYFDWSTLRIPGVLQRIAIVFCLSGIIFLKFSWKVHTGLAVGILLGYWLIMVLVPVPGVGPANLEMGSNLAAWVDSQLLAGHMWRFTQDWDPEGVFTTIPAISTCLLGILLGQWLQQGRSMGQKLAFIHVGAAVLIFLGLGWSLVFPLNKNLWSSSYVLYTGGLGIFILAAFYWLLDVKKMGSTIFKPFVMFGYNAIAAYVLSMLCAIALYEIKFDSQGAQGAQGEIVSLQAWLFQRLVYVVDNPYTASLVFALLFSVLMFLPIWVLYRKNIIIKV